MKDTLTDANFPRTADLRVYHLGLRPGEVANRIVTVGSPSRARIIASYLDPTPKPFELASERGFLTITGRYQGVPVSICSIGMGMPNLDFFVRETRECIAGDMVVIRLGSCGGLADVPVGTVVVPRACVAIQRNVDYDYHHPEANEEAAYRISKPVAGDSELEAQLQQCLEATRPEDAKILTGIVNAAADTFYASQGRLTSFPDCNQGLLQELLSTVPDLATLEMETHHLYHLAKCWNRPPSETPLTTSPVLLSSTSSSAQNVLRLAAPDTLIRVSAAQIVFAARFSRDFIDPNKVKEREHWAGKAVLETLVKTDLAEDKLHPEEGSVWAL